MVVRFSLKHSTWVFFLFQVHGVSKRLLKGFLLPNLVVLVGPLFFLCFSAEEMWLVLSCLWPVDAVNWLLCKCVICVHSNWSFDRDQPTTRTPSVVLLLVGTCSIGTSMQLLMMDPLLWKGWGFGVFFLCFWDGCQVKYVLWAFSNIWMPWEILSGKPIRQTYFKWGLWLL